MLSPTPLALQVKVLYSDGEIYTPTQLETSQLSTLNSVVDCTGEKQVRVAAGSVQATLAAGAGGPREPGRPTDGPVQLSCLNLCRPVTCPTGVRHVATARTGAAVQPNAKPLQVVALEAGAVKKRNGAEVITCMKRRGPRGRRGRKGMAPW